MHRDQELIYSYFTALHCETESFLIKWCLTARCRPSWLVMHSYLKFCLQTNSSLRLIKKVELNQTEVRNNENWPFFSSSTVIISFWGPLSLRKRKTNRLSLLLLSPFLLRLIPLSSAVTVGLEWAVKAAWSPGNTPSIYFQALIERCR